MVSKNHNLILEKWGGAISDATFQLGGCSLGLVATTPVVDAMVTKKLQF